MAKIVLFEVPGVVLRRKSDKVVLGEMLTDYPKHSQLMVAGALRNLGVELEIVDMKSMDPTRLEKYGELNYGEHILEKLMVGASFNSVKDHIIGSDVVGITANFTYESAVVKRFIKFVKKVNPHSNVVVGGSDATGRPEHYISAGADVVMLGKAEITGPIVINALLKECTLEGIQGIVYRDPISGALKVSRKNRGIRTNIDRLPFPALELAEKYRWTQIAEHGLPEGVSNKVGVLEMSRGCDEACSFCATTFQIGTYNTMSLNRIKKNLDHLQSFGIKTIVFIDDNLLYRIKTEYGGSRARAELIVLFNEMAGRGLAWNFYNGIHFGLLEDNGQIDVELIEAMFQNNNVVRKKGQEYVGAFRAYIPLERLTEKGRLRFRKLKPFDVQDRIIAEIAKRKPAGLNFGFIIGYPSDSIKSLKEMEKRALEIKKLVYNVSVRKTASYFLPFCLIPLPDTPNYSEILMEGRFAYSVEEHPELMNGYTSIIKGDKLFPHEFTNWQMCLSSKLNS